MKDDRLAGWSRNPWTLSLGVFSLYVLTRLVAAPFYELSEVYMWDGMLDTCVKPWQFATGQPIAGGDNSYVSYLTNYAGARLFGYSVHHVQVFTIVLTALAMSLFFCALHNIFGLATAGRTMAIVLVSLPFITQGALATEMPTALWGLSLVFLVLTWGPSWQRDLALAGSCVVVLFGYAAGVVTVIPLIGWHILFFRMPWPARRVLSFSGFMGVALLLVWGIRRAVTGNGNFKRWGINDLEIPSLPNYFDGIRVMLRDIFWSAETWCAAAYTKPYLNFLFCLLLLITLIRVAQLLIGKLLVPQGRPELTDQERWQFIFLLTFCVAPLIAGLNVFVPGVRRIYPAVLFLFALLAAAPNLGWRSVWVPRLLNGLFLVGLIWEATSSTRVIKGLWPPPPAAKWFMTAERIAGEVRNLDRPAIVIVDREVEPALDRIFCRLYLDHETRAKAVDFYGLEPSGQGAVAFSKNGDPNQPGKPALEQGFVFVTKSQARADQLLPQLLAKTTAGDSLKRVLLIENK